MSDDEILSYVSEHTGELKAVAWLKNIRLNQKHTGFERTVRLLRGAYQNQKAVVIGAGPAFKRFGTQDLAKIRGEEIVKIACDGALQTLYEAGVDPDIVCSVDCHPVVANFYRRTRFSKPPMFLLSTTVHRDVVSEIVSKYGGDGIFWWQAASKQDLRKKDRGFDASKLYVPNIPVIYSGGNVGTTCFVLASQLLGCKPIGLLGLEFAWSDETPLMNSVPAYSPILVKRPDGWMKLTSFSDIWSELALHPSIFPDFDDGKTLQREVKMLAGHHWYTASEHGHWTEIKNISRHYYSGDLVRINAHTGLVDVTPNHSIYVRHPVQENIGAKTVLKSADDVEIGDRLYSPFISLAKKRYHGTLDFDSDLAWLYGFFAAEGCAANVTQYPYYIQVSNNNEEYLQKFHDVLEAKFNVGASIGHRKTEGKEHQGWVIANSKPLWQKFRAIFYTPESEKKVPDCVINAKHGAKQAFLDGYIDGDGHRTSVSTSYVSTSQVLACGVLYLALNCNSKYSYSLWADENKGTVNVLLNNSGDNHRRLWRVKSIKHIPYTGWVYDFETVNHKFLSGVGLPKVHNTQYYEQIMKLVDGDPERLHKHFKRVKNLRDGKTYIADPVYYCFSEDTRVLTKEGFKNYNNITYDDEIATVSEKGTFEYQKPSSIHIYPSYEGDMFLFEGEQVSFLVTPNHRMHLMVNGKPELLEAQELAVRRSNMKIGCKSEGLTHARLLKELDWKGCNSEAIEIPQVKYGGHPGQNLVSAIRTEVFVKFLGWYLAEGSLANNGRGPQYQICLGAQERWLTDYADALNRMGIRWQRVQYTNVPGIRFNSKQIYTYLLPLGKSGTKYIPEEIKQLSPHYLKILLSTLIDGDGTVNSNNVTQYTTMSKRLAEDVAEIAIKCGYWARIGRRKSGIYLVTIPRKYRGIMMPEAQKISYRGVVWCVSVPNRTLIVERKGRIAISGNSYFLAFRDLWKHFPRCVRRSTFNLTREGILSARGLKTVTMDEFIEK